MTLVVAQNQTVIYKWGFDFVQSQYAESVTISGVGASAEYGIAEYGISEYQGSLGVVTISVNAKGSGKVLQVGFEADINGDPISIQKIDIYTKDGRI